MIPGERLSEMELARDAQNFIKLKATKAAFTEKRVTEEACKRLRKIIEKILKRFCQVKEVQLRNPEEKGI